MVELMDKNFIFTVEENCLTSLIAPSDGCQMNWVKEGRKWGDVQTRVALSVAVKRKVHEEYLEEQYLFKNETNKPIYTKVEDISIELPLPDEYIASEESRKKRCHSHLWCGENSSYFLGMRMGGDAPHLAVIVTTGGFSKYSIIRQQAKLSNDRGVFLLHPTPMVIFPGESKVFTWHIRWVDSREDFEVVRLKYSNQVAINMNHFVLFKQETGVGTVTFNSAIDLQKVSLQWDEENINFQVITPHEIQFTLKGLPLGEQCIKVKYQGNETHLTILQYPRFTELFEKRIQFIAEKQQYFSASYSKPNGAFIPYDTEEHHQYYAEKYDYNAGRERLGMGVSLIRYLKKHPESILRKNLQAYVDFVLRELIDAESGEVFNDFDHAFFFRLYNYSWAALFFLELYQFTKEAHFLVIMSKIMKRYYQEGGSNFYPLLYSFSQMIVEVRAVLGDELADELTVLVKNHADTIVKVGLNYPASEVNYEQSIVAPAVDILLEMYLLSKEPCYLAAAKKHLALLELFEGQQPNHHLYGTSIRHWDGYWFGKRKLLGDTFPHYWSALNGQVYLKMYRITHDENYLKRAHHATRGCLSLIHPSGAASCAYLYPYQINGQRAELFEPLANDQDWILYFYDVLASFN